MKRATLGALLVIAIALAAGFGAYAATTGDDDDPKAGGTPVGHRFDHVSKCRAEDPNCLARIDGREGDSTNDPVPAGGGAAGSCLVGTNCEDTPETPTKAEETLEEPGTGTTPSASLGMCAEEAPDCVDAAVTTTTGGEE